MKIIFSFLLLFFSLYLSAKEVVIDGQKYEVEKEAYDEYGEKGIVLNFYRLPKKSHSSLMFLLTQTYGSCTQKNYEESTYDINGSLISIYTKWSGYSIDGYRKMIYKFDKNNKKAKRILCKFYIDSRNEDDKNSGVQYLQNATKTPQEQELLNEYIHSIEKLYKGKFLQDDEAVNLSKEVEAAFSKSLQNRWGNQ